jgi:hypothetical protein
LKYVAWSPFGLPLDFNTLSEGIKILGVMLGNSTFTSSFIKNAMPEDVQHVELLFIVVDVHVGFKILIHSFVQHPSYF